MLGLSGPRGCASTAGHVLRTFSRARVRSLHVSPPSLYSPPAWTTNIPSGAKVTVAMSGGVDSSVVLALLASSPLDLDLRAVFMRNWSPQLSESEAAKVPADCAWEKDWEDVRRVCKALGGVECEMIDLSNEYWMRVFEPSIEAWQAGQTPNPDVGCNREIKFGALMNRVLRSPGEFLATGHYAAIDRSNPGRTKLLRALDPTKDQSYYLSSVPEAQLARAIFPLAGHPKTQVRELARKFALPTAEREESMGVCFIGERGRFGDFISQYATSDSASVAGPILAPNGTPLGTHAGLWHYTIGQRARLGGMDQAWFVARKDSTRNAVVVVPGSRHPALMCTSLFVPDFKWIHEDLRHSNGELSASSDPQIERLRTALSSEQGLRVQVQVRHRMRPVSAIARYAEGQVEIVFPRDAPCHAVAEGQVAAIWVERDPGGSDGRRRGDAVVMEAGPAEETGGDRWEWCIGSGVIGSTRCVEEV